MATVRWRGSNVSAPCVTTDNALPRATSQGTDTRFEFGQFKWLYEVIVGTEIKAAHAVFHRIQRGEDEHRHIDFPFARALQHLESIEPWQADIEYQQIEMLGQ